MELPKRLKKFVVSLSPIDEGDEIMVMAKNKEEAKKKAEREIYRKKLNLDFYISGVSELIEEINNP